MILEKNGVLYEIGNIGVNEAREGDVVRTAPDGPLEIILAYSTSNGGGKNFTLESGRVVSFFQVWNYGRRVD